VNRLRSKSVFISDALFLFSPISTLLVSHCKGTNFLPNLKRQIHLC
jgi:hypothetical protein